MTMNGYVSNTSGSEEPRGVSYDTPSSLFSPKTFYFFNFSHFFLLFFNNFPSNSLQIFKLQSYTLHRTSKQKIKSTKKWVFLEICVNARWEKTFFWILFKIGFCEIIITECPSVHRRSLRNFFPQVMSKKFDSNFLSQKEPQN